MAQPRTEQELIDKWLNKEINVEIKTTDDVELFTLVLATSLIDCYNEPQFKQWLNSDSLAEKMKAGASLARPILSAFMFSKENQKEMWETKTDERTEQDINKSK